MTEVIQTVAPFLLALYLLFAGVLGKSGETWFKQRATRNLAALKVEQPDGQAEDLWKKAEAASQPGALGVLALVTILGLYLLLPTDSRYGWVFGLVLFAAALGAVALAYGVKPEAQFNLGGRKCDVARTISVALIVVGMIGSVVKLLVS